MRTTREPVPDPTLAIDPRDLALLLTTEPGALLGRIMALNREPRYHNTLDAIRLAMRLMELRAQQRGRDDRRP